MSIGNVERKDSQIHHSNLNKNGLRSLNAPGRQNGAANPFLLDSSNTEDIQPLGPSEPNNPNKPQNALDQLNQAIQPSNLSNINIGMNTPTNNSSQERNSANGNQRSVPTEGNTAAIGSMQSDESTPGKALSQEVMQIQREIGDIGRTAMEQTADAGSGSASSGDGGVSTAGLAAAGAALVGVGMAAKQSDTSHQKGTQLGIMSKMKDMAASAMKTSGGIMEATGTGLSIGGQAMIAAGQAMMACIFTIIPGAIMVAAGTAMKIAGTALKVAGKVVKAAGAAAAAVAKTIGNNSSNLLKKATATATNGRKALTGVRGSLQKIKDKMRKNPKKTLAAGVATAGAMHVMKSKSSSKTNGIEAHGKNTDTQTNEGNWVGGSLLKGDTTTTTIAR